MTIQLQFAKVRPSAIIPSKREEDMGYDIYACFEQDFLLIPPHQIKLIPTGIASACPIDYAFVLKERGSTGTKGIAQRCGVIDSGYRNEWFVPLQNTNDQPLILVKAGKEAPEGIHYPYEKAIAQAILLPVPTTTVQECSYADLQTIVSARGKGSLGSSGK